MSVGLYNQGQGREVAASSVCTKQAQRSSFDPLKLGSAEGQKRRQNVSGRPAIGLQSPATLLCRPILNVPKCFKCKPLNLRFSFPVGNEGIQWYNRQTKTQNRFFGGIGQNTSCSDGVCPLSCASLAKEIADPFKNRIKLGWHCASEAQ